MIAGQADLWNIPGGDIADAGRRSEILDGYCRESGRATAEITRSIVLQVSRNRLDAARSAIDEALAARFPHIVPGLAAPCADDLARWVADEMWARLIDG